MNLQHKSKIKPITFKIWTMLEMLGALFVGCNKLSKEKTYVIELLSYCQHMADTLIKLKFLNRYIFSNTPSVFNPERFCFINFDLGLCSYWSKDKTQSVVQGCCKAEDKRTAEAYICSETHINPVMTTQANLEHCQTIHRTLSLKASALTPSSL